MFAALNRPGREVYRSPPPTAEVENVSLHLYLTCMPSWCRQKFSAATVTVQMISIFPASYYKQSFIAAFTKAGDSKLTESTWHCVYLHILPLVRTLLTTCCLGSCQLSATSRFPLSRHACCMSRLSQHNCNDRPNHVWWRVEMKYVQSFWIICGMVENVGPLLFVWKIVCTRIWKGEPENDSLANKPRGIILAKLGYILSAYLL
jgi:hypothetical protein